MGEKVSVSRMTTDRCPRRPSEEGLGTDNLIIGITRAKAEQASQTGQVRRSIIECFAARASGPCV